MEKNKQEVVNGLGGLVGVRGWGLWRGRASASFLEVQNKSPNIVSIQDFYFLSTFFSLNRETIISLKS